MQMPGAAANEFVRQHLIDPEICIRCNTCEEICPSKAISHDNVNYVVDFAKCVGKGDCLPPCPTGAIDNWRRVARPLTVTEQFALESLPPDAEPVISGGGGPVPDDVQRITAEASAGSGGCEVPPWSAAHPYVSLYAPEAPAKAIVSGNYRLTEPGSSVDIHHLVLDFGKTAFPVLEGQSIGILPPGLDETGKPHHVRLYSVASPREGERPGYNNVALSIKRVVEDATGRRVHGIASNYMCDLKKGDEVKVTGPYGTTFLMPNNPGANIIMICTGTGSAPMRAMTERLRRRRHRGDQGQLRLFFGARTSGELPYFGPLMKLPKEFIDVQLAFSREPGHGKEYVQDRMRRRSSDIADLLRSEDTYIFICGHKRMERGVADSFTEICATHGMNWAELMPRLRQEGRYHVETYY